MQSNTKYRSIFNGDIRVSLKTAAGILAAYPSSAASFARIAKRQRKAEKIRKGYIDEGIDVPALLIISATSECNLSCAGCYSCERSDNSETTLPDSRISEILKEASNLGVSAILLAGGEPLLSRSWLDAMRDYPDMLGIVFTNGTMLGEAQRDWFARHRHIIPAISIEGSAEQTDARRGEGVYAKVVEAMSALNKSGVPFGVSITVTSGNIDSVLTAEYTREHISRGCRLFIYVEYVPVAADTRNLVLSKADKKRLSAFVEERNKGNSAFHLAFPGDEEPYGGCLAAGRGFLHINANGAVEPCPFAPFSDVSLRDTDLKTALGSKLLKTVRDNHSKLVEGEGGCALWNNRQWLESIAKQDQLPL